jgi:hypothetical protein
MTGMGEKPWMIGRERELKLEDFLRFRLVLVSVSSVEHTRILISLLFHRDKYQAAQSRSDLLDAKFIPTPATIFEKIAPGERDRFNNLFKLCVINFLPFFSLEFSSFFIHVK